MVHTHFKPCSVTCGWRRRCTPHSSLTLCSGIVAARCLTFLSLFSVSMLLHTAPPLRPPRSENVKKLVCNTMPQDPDKLPLDWAEDEVGATVGV